MLDERLAGLGYESDEPADISSTRWVQAQRDLITTTLDYNLQTVATLVAEGRIDLSPPSSGASDGTTSDGRDLSSRL